MYFIAKKNIALSATFTNNNRDTQFKTAENVRYFEKHIDTQNLPRECHFQNKFKMRN